jgi:probable rRNA maturation factor
MATPTRLRVSLTAPDGPVAAGRGLAAWLSRVAPARASGEVTVALVSNRRMRALNRMFRGQDRVTDVLSFATADSAAPRPTMPASLGDVVIAVGVATRQASDYGHGVGTELRVLALHGLLHLLGYDHEVDAGRMARVEARLRRKGGLPAGLIGRAAEGRSRGHAGRGGTAGRRRGGPRAGQRT